MWSVMDKQRNSLNLPHRTESWEVLSWSINYPWSLEPKVDQKGPLLEHIPSNMNLVYAFLPSVLKICFNMSFISLPSSLIFFGLMMLVNRTL